MRTATREQVAWGEADPAAKNCKSKFLYTGTEPRGAAPLLRQATIQPLTGIEWLSRNLVESLVMGAAEIGVWLEEAGK